MAMRTVGIRSPGSAFLVNDLRAVVGRPEQAQPTLISPTQLVSIITLTAPRSWQDAGGPGKQADIIFERIEQES